MKRFSNFFRRKPTKQPTEQPTEQPKEQQTEQTEQPEQPTPKKPTDSPYKYDEYGYLLPDENAKKYREGYAKIIGTYGYPNADNFGRALGGKKYTKKRHNRYKKSGGKKLKRKMKKTKKQHKK